MATDAGLAALKAKVDALKKKEAAIKAEHDKVYDDIKKLKSDGKPYAHLEDKAVKMRMEGHGYFTERQEAERAVKDYAQRAKMEKRKVEIGKMKKELERLKALASDYEAAMKKFTSKGKIREADEQKRLFLTTKREYEKLDASIRELGGRN